MPLRSDRDTHADADPTAAAAAILVARMGVHPSRALALDLDSASDADLWGWLVACTLLQTRSAESTALAAWRALAAAGFGAGPESLAPADPLHVAALLAQAELARADAAALGLVRLARGLCERWHGSLARVYAGADGLDDLGERLTRLAPGFGARGAARYLRALREPWPLAAELPLTPAALAAAAHLGFAREPGDPDDPSAARAAAAGLQRRLREARGAPCLRDVEAALERLGAAACSRRRPARCPLAEACTRPRDRG